MTFIKKAVFGRTPYWRQYFWNKWGFLEKSLRRDLKNKKVLWINAISGGEVAQIGLFSRRLKEALPVYKTVLSTESYDAFKYASSTGIADHIIDSPWDIGAAIERALKIINPSAIIYVENAYYPVMLRLARERGIKNILISGRMNDLVLKGQLVARRALEMEFFKYLDAVGAKTESDREGFLRLGVASSKIAVLGDLRCDLEYLRMDSVDRSAMRKKFGFSDTDLIFMAGSVHPEEFELVISAFMKARYLRPALKMVIAPRWRHEAGKLESLAVENGLNVNRRSSGDTGKASDVFILDTFGELARAYGVADVIYIGNSLVPINERGAGHNIIEPLIHGRPIVFGPYMNFWRDVVGEIRKICPQCEVKDKDELAARICSLMDDKDLAVCLGDLGIKIAREHSGVVERYVKFVKDNC